MAKYPLDQLRALLKLQGLDTRIDGIRVELKRAEEGEDLTPLRTDLATARQEASQKAGQLAKLRRDLKFQEQEVAALRAEVAAQERKLYGGLVRNPKEAAQMQQHVASLRRRMGDLDDHALSLMLEIENAEPEAAAAGERVAAVEEQLAERQAMLTAKVQELGEAIPVLCEQREAIAESLPAALYKEYQTLRPRRAGTAVVPLIDGKCGGCRMTIPYIMVRDIRTGELRTCDTCGRIVVEPE